MVKKKGAFKIVAFVFRSFLLHCHAEARSILSIAERDARLDGQSDRLRASA